jgi:ankyrin repeat protein
MGFKIDRSSSAGSSVTTEASQPKAKSGLFAKICAFFTSKSKAKSMAKVSSSHNATVGSLPDRSGAATTSEAMAARRPPPILSATTAELKRVMDEEDVDISRMTELIESGADPTVASSFGYTPLHVAVQYCGIADNLQELKKMIGTLQAKGKFEIACKATAKGKSGKTYTPLALALHMKNEAAASAVMDALGPKLVGKISGGKTKIEILAGAFPRIAVAERMKEKCNDFLEKIKEAEKIEDLPTVKEMEGAIAFMRSVENGQSVSKAMLWSPQSAIDSLRKKVESLPEDNPMKIRYNELKKLLIDSFEQAEL